MTVCTFIRGGGAARRPPPPLPPIAAATRQPARQLAWYVSPTPTPTLSAGENSQSDSDSDPTHLKHSQSDPGRSPTGSDSDRVGLRPGRTPT
eukprot:gene7823-biopygen12091